MSERLEEPRRQIKEISLETAAKLSLDQLQLLARTSSSQKIRGLPKTEEDNRTHTQLETSKGRLIILLLEVKIISR